MWSKWSAQKKRYARESGVVGLVVLVWSAWIYTAAGGAAVSQTVSNVGLAFSAIAAAGACYFRARVVTGKTRRFFVLLGAGVGSWSVGQIIWTWYESVLGREVPFPSLADVGYLAFVPLAAAALLCLPSGAQNVAGRARTVLDGLMIAGSLLLISWLMVLGPLIHAGGGLGSQVISLAYPLGDVVIVTMVLFVLLRLRQTSTVLPLPLLLIGTGLVAFSIADTGFTYLTMTGSYASGNIIDIGWFVGFALIFLAGRRPVPRNADLEMVDLQGQPFGLMVPYIAVVGAIFFTTLHQIRGAEFDPFVSWNRTILMLLMIVRQILTLLENSSLTRHLEARVIERTAELKTSEQRFEALVQHSSDVVTLVDLDGRIMYQSESIQEIFGYEPNGLLNENFAELIEFENRAEFLQMLADAAGRREGVLVVELPIRHEDGRKRHAEVTVTNLLENPAVGGLVLNTCDISGRKELEDQLVHQAFHDSLTLLANRALFKDRVDHALSRNAGSSETAVLFLDLDGFKAVNDSLGHASGDLLLVQVAERLRSCVRPGDTVARLGGDEFAILLEDVGEVEETSVARRVIDSLEEAFNIDGKEIHVRGSVGIATADSDVTGSDQLLRNADLAMYRAKSAGDGEFERFDPEMHTDLVRRVEMESDLRRAVENSEFVIHYQPIISLTSGKVEGVEALVRWEHPEFGQIQPDKFIPLAEDTGLISPIGKWVLEKACMHAVSWQRRHPHAKNLAMSVNISPRQLKREDLVEDVANALRTSGLAPSCLVLEMTERVLVDNEQTVLEMLAGLKGLGVRLAIDDFGTGYSSLSYLHLFPVDVLKIDRSFVERIQSPSDDGQLVGTIVRLGQSLGLTTIAEGIEDYQQFLSLRRMGCDRGQGYYFSRPVPPRQINKILADGEIAPGGDISPFVPAKS